MKTTPQKFAQCKSNNRTGQTDSFYSASNLQANFNLYMRRPPKSLKKGGDTQPESNCDFEKRKKKKRK